MRSVRRALSLLVLGGALIAAPSVQADEAPEFWSLVEAAVEAHQQGKYAQAVEHFERAFEVAPKGTDVATLRFNVAVSLFELGRYAEAEQRFIEASTDEVLRPIALLNAGIAAVKDGRINDAERHLDASRANVSEPSKEQQQLDKKLVLLIDEFSASVEMRQFDDALTRAIKYLEQGEPGKALSLMQRTSLKNRLSEDKLRWREIVIAAASDAKQWQLASEQLAIALKEHPKDADLRLASAEVAFFLGDYDAAEANWRKAIRLGLQPGQEREAKRRLQSLRPLPREGWTAWGTISGGHDSNAQQTSAEITLDSQTGETVSAELGSVVGTLGAELGYVHRLNSALALTPYAQSTLYGLFAADAQPFSIWLQELGARLEHVFGPKSALMLSLAGGVSLQGLQDIGVFAYEIGLGAQYSYRMSPRQLFRISLAVRPTRGGDDMDYLTGARVFGRAQQRWRFGWGRLLVQAGVRGYFAGAQTVTGFDEVQCADGCDITAPLSFFAPHVGFALDWSIHSRVSLRGTVNYEFRQYLEDGGTQLVPLSQFERKDNRLNAGLRLDAGLDERGAFVAFARYDFLLSRSNVAFDPDDASSLLHYGNYNFEQQVVELGFEFLF